MIGPRARQPRGLLDASQRGGLGLGQLPEQRRLAVTIPQVAVLERDAAGDALLRLGEKRQLTLGFEGHQTEHGP